MLDGIVIEDLRSIPDERGYIKHIMKKSQFPLNQDFGEVYLSCIYPGIVKGWHLHKRQTQNYVCIKGNIKLVLFDMRESSSTFNSLQEIVMGELNYVRVTIPVGVCNGYISTGGEEAWVINVSDLEHDPSEMDRFNPRDRSIVEYNWEPVDK